MEIFEKIERTRHFGELFLLWLWYHSQVDDTIFYLSDKTTLSLAIDSQIILEAHLSESERTTLSGGAPAESREAFEAIRQGKIADFGGEVREQTAKARHKEAFYSVWGFKAYNRGLGLIFSPWRKIRSIRGRH